MLAIDRLRAIAATQHGLVTTGDALELEIGDSMLRKHEGRELQRLAPGIYWFVPDAPGRRLTPDERGQLRGQLEPTTTLHAAVLHAARCYSRRSVKRRSAEGFVAASHASALALYKMGEHPERPVIAVPRGFREYDTVRWYACMPEDLTLAEVCNVDGIPSVTPPKALAQVGEVFEEMRAGDWSDAFAHIESRVREIVGDEPSRAQDLLARMVAAVGQLAVATSIDDDHGLTAAVDRATRVLEHWPPGDA